MSYYDEVIADSAFSYLRCDDNGGSAYDEGNYGIASWYSYIPLPGQVSLIADGANSWGVDQYSEISTYDYFPDSGGAWSAEMWMLFDPMPDSGTSDYTLLQFGSYDQATLILTADWGSGYQFIYTSNSEYIVFGSSIPVNDATEHHIVITFTAYGSIELYIDGVLQDSQTISTYPYESYNGNRWLGNPGWGQYGLNGLVDELAVYDFALDSTRIGVHYTAGVGGPPASTVDSGPLALSGESSVTGFGKLLLRSGALAATGESSATGFGTIVAKSGALSATGESDTTGAGGLLFSLPAVALTGESSTTGAGSVIGNSGALGATGESSITGTGGLLFNGTGALTGESSATGFGTGIFSNVLLDDITAESDLGGYGHLAEEDNHERNSGDLSMSGESDASGAGTLLPGFVGLVLTGESTAAGAGALVIRGVDVDLSAESVLDGAGTRVLVAVPVALSGESEIAGAGALVLVPAQLLTLAGESFATGAGDLKPLNVPGRLTNVAVFLHARLDTDVFLQGSVDLHAFPKGSLEIEVTK